MLNLSENRIEGKINLSLYQSFGMIKDQRAGRVFYRLIIITFLILLFTLFLPWTQNINTKGYITTLQPNQRPQMVNSIIAGRIEKWFVREGIFVNKGDTLLFISEIKDEYFDPNLLNRTEEQIKSKELSVDSYMDKVKSIDNQIDALLKTKKLKIEQTENYLKQSILKIESDSNDLIAAMASFSVAKEQAERMQQLYDQGLKSLTELETRQIKLQEAQAKKISAENKLLASRNEMLNVRIELISIENQYKDKLSKAESDKYSALSAMYDTEALVTKMQNQYMNYSVRSGMYYIVAPQDGYVTQTIRSGIGETIKEGEALMSIMPARYDLAVSMYVRPMDLPLINQGQEVRFMFDGWPSVVFTGWPGLSYGTFGGVVVAVDNFISENGQYRILVKPNPNEQAWPDGLRVGSGANGIALLKDVPIWYELWRNLNGFPPDFYQPSTDKKNSDKKEKNEK